MISILEGGSIHHYSEQQLSMNSRDLMSHISIRLLIAIFRLGEMLREISIFEASRLLSFFEQIRNGNGNLPSSSSSFSSSSNSIHRGDETYYELRRMNGDGVTSPFSHTHYENVARSNARTIEARNDLSRHRSRDISHLTCKIDIAAMCLVRRVSLSPFFFLFSENANHSVARTARSREREGGEGNKLKRTKWGWYEDDIQIRWRRKRRKYTYVARTLRASRVIGWYSDTKKLSFAFIPANRIEGMTICPKSNAPSLRFEDTFSISESASSPICLAVFVLPLFPSKIPRRNASLICSCQPPSSDDHWSSHC